MNSRRASPSVFNDEKELGSPEDDGEEESGKAAAAAAAAANRRRRKKIMGMKSWDIGLTFFSIGEESADRSERERGVKVKERL